MWFLDVSGDLCFHVLSMPWSLLLFINSDMPPVRGVWGARCRSHGVRLVAIRNRNVHLFQCCQGQLGAIRYCQYCMSKSFKVHQEGIFPHCCSERIARGALRCFSKLLRRVVIRCPCQACQGFGFIDMGGQTLFVHFSECEVGKQPKEGDILTFQYEPRR